MDSFNFKIISRKLYSNWWKILKQYNDLGLCVLNDVIGFDVWKNPTKSVSFHRHQNQKHQRNRKCSTQTLQCLTYTAQFKLNWTNWITIYRNCICLRFRMDISSFTFMCAKMPKFHMPSDDCKIHFQVKREKISFESNKKFFYPQKRG